jgi:hypothetical protein
MTKYAWCKKTYLYDDYQDYKLWIKGKKYEITYNSGYNYTIRREYVGGEYRDNKLVHSFSISNNEFREYFNTFPNKLNKQIHTI